MHRRTPKRKPPTKLNFKDLPQDAQDYLDGLIEIEKLARSPWKGRFDDELRSTVSPALLRSLHRRLKTAIDALTPPGTRPTLLDPPARQHSTGGGYGG